MSDIPDRLRRMNQSAAQRQMAAQFSALCRVLMVSNGQLGHAAELARTYHPGMPELETVLRTAVSAGSLSNDSSIAQLKPLSDAWLQSLVSQSVFDTVVAGGATVVPLNSKIVSVSGAAGVVVAEGAQRPLLAGSTASFDIQPRTAVAICALSNQVIRYSAPAAETVLEIELAKGVSEATDGVFLGEIYAASTPAASAGLPADVKTLLTGLTIRPQSKILVIAEPSACVALALLTTIDGGARSFPSLGLTGGILVPGTNLMASDQLPSGAVLAIDCSSFAAGSGPLEVVSAKHALLELSNSPDSPPSPSGVYTSLYQQGLTGLQVKRDFGWAVGRSGSVSSLSGVSWGS